MLLNPQHVWIAPNVNTLVNNNPQHHFHILLHHHYNHHLLHLMVTLYMEHHHHQKRKTKTLASALLLQVFSAAPLQLLMFGSSISLHSCALWSRPTFCFNASSSCSSTHDVFLFLLFFSSEFCGCLSLSSLQQLSSDHFKLDIDTMCLMLL